MSARRCWPGAGEGGVAPPHSHPPRALRTPALSHSSPLAVAPRRHAIGIGPRGPADARGVTGRGRRCAPTRLGHSAPLAIVPRRYAPTPHPPGEFLREVSTWLRRDGCEKANSGSRNEIHAWPHLVHSDARDVPVVDTACGSVCDWRRAYHTAQNSGAGAPSHRPRFGDTGVTGVTEAN